MMTRDEKILSLENHVKKIARALARHLPYLRAQHYDDLEQAGWLGAIEAVDRFGPERGDFFVYAKRLIQGRVLDQMRGADYLDRSHRRKIKTGLLPPIKFVDPGHAQSKSDGSDLNRATIAAIDSERLLDRSELSERYQKVIFAYYWCGDHQREIGLQMGVEQARVSQIHRRALQLMREAA